MEVQHPNSRTESGAMTIWTFMVLAAVVVVIALGAAFFAYRSTHHERTVAENKAKELEAQKVISELQRQKGQEDAKLLVARSRQEAALAVARTATNVLGELLIDSDSLRADAQALKSNDAGKAVALHPDLVLLARRFFESELKNLPAREEVVFSLENARRTDQQLSSSLGTAYEPSADFLTNLQASISWAEGAKRSVTQARQALDSLVQESKVKVSANPVTSSTPTLDAAISRVNTAEADQKLKESDQVLAAAKASAELEALKAEKDKIIASAKREADTVRAQIEEEKEKWERERKERESELVLEESKTQAAVLRNETEAQKVLLRQKASDQAVLAKLTPFTTPGYWQLNKMSTEKKPLSYSQLQNVGALSPDAKGLTTLLKIAWTSTDRVRQRWTMNPSLFLRNPQQLEKVREAQALLIELGPVLVEKGLLEP